MIFSLFMLEEIYIVYLFINVMNLKYYTGINTRQETKAIWETFHTNDHILV